MSATTFEKDELCVDNDCRYLPKNGPISVIPSMRFDMASIINYIICCVLVMLLIFALSPMVIKMNSKRIINMVKNTVHAPKTAADLLASTTSSVNITDL